MWKPPPIRTALLEKARLDGEGLAGLAGGFAGLATILGLGVAGAAAVA